MSATDFRDLSGNGADYFPGANPLWKADSFQLAMTRISLPSRVIRHTPVFTVWTHSEIAIR